jgi:hypothetical protein
MKKRQGMIKGDMPLFCNQRCTKLTYGGVNYIMKKVDFVYICDILGHVGISTSDIYARADTESKRKALESDHIKRFTRMEP